MDRSHEERVARNQGLFREINERVEELNSTFHHHPSDPLWVCECPYQDCIEQVEMSLAEYAAVREDPTHFVVAPGEDHVVPDVERIVSKGERYWVVEKTGQAGVVAEEMASDR